MASPGLPHLNLGQREFLRRLRELAETHQALIGRAEISFKENTKGQVVFAVILSGPPVIT
jgi:hypothetical protein